MSRFRSLTRYRFILALGLTAAAACAALILVCHPGPASGAREPAKAWLFGQAVSAIERHYYDPDRINPRKMLKAALEQIEKSIPEILVTFEDREHIEVTVGLASKRFKTKHLKRLSSLRKVMHKVSAFINEHYKGDTPLEEIEYAATDGMLKALDPHSSFLPPKIYNEFKVGTRGKFGGLGIVISIREGMLTVIAPLEGTPASRAGIRAGDRIIQINEESTINMSLTDAVNRLRGKVGTKVTIVLERTGRPARKITLTRAIINIDSVQHTLIRRGDKRIGYIKIKSFLANTDDDVRTALEEFHQGDAALDGLVLDLRNNPGGLLNIAAEVADHFLNDGVIVSTVGPLNQVFEEAWAEKPNTEPDYPVITIINEGSASASEILAGALQAQDRALVMGRRSFGKGSVQTVFEVGDDAAMKLTIAQYMPAGTETIQLVGVTPDVQIIPVTIDRDDINIKEDTLRREKDLEEHLENEGKDKARAKIQSPFSIQYLKPKEPEDEIRARALREYTEKLRIEDDFTSALAVSLIEKAGRPSRSKMLDHISKPLDQARLVEERKSRVALKRLGIDWSSTPARGVPKLSVGYHMLAGKRRLRSARAGSKIRLELAATNRGSGPYSRLIAVGKSDTSFLSNREFVFGQLGPTLRRKWSVPLEIPEALPTQNLTMEISFEEEYGRDPEPMTIVIPVKGLPHPRFAINYRLTGVTRGQPLPKGSPMGFQVAVANVGKGTSSKETTATISNECGEKLFIEKGRVTLGRVHPGTKRRATFRFHLTGDVEGEDCAIELAVVDIKRNTLLQKKIALVVDEGRLDPPSRKSYQPPKIEFTGLPKSTDKDSVRILGTISDTDIVKDYYVFAGDEKVAYVPNLENTTSVPISVLIPLKPGNNHVLVAGRDVLDLTAREIFVIERIEEAESGEGGGGQSASKPGYLQ